MKIENLNADLLIIGGGAAGIFSALKAAENNLNVIIVDKGHMKRSGCLASGVNALNAYINKGESPNSYLEYVKNDFKNIVRDDLVLSIANRLNEVTKRVESLGLPILKDQNGDYVERGKRSIKINGENIKPILYKSILNNKNIKILNYINIFDLKKDKDTIIGAYGMSLKDSIIYNFNTKGVICATGGASGIYKPNNPGYASHKLWYSPFNTGAGYAMGIRSGAEMTSFEMRFIALRCKDTIAPTGTIAQGLKAKMLNNKGEEYVNLYGKGSTDDRLYSTIMENLKGNGPCYLNTKGILEEKSKDLIKAYLNMAPSQVLKWFSTNTSPKHSNVLIDGTEPYIVGGHTSSGYWIDTKRRTTLKGLYAAGDVAGGSPKKYVTGAFSEGIIAVEAFIEDYNNLTLIEKPISTYQLNRITKFLDTSLKSEETYEKISQLENKLQETMDKYCGGKSTYYTYSTNNLKIGKIIVESLLHEAENLKASSPHEIVLILEVIDRIYVSLALITHLEARKESRWKCYSDYTDYPFVDSSFEKYVNTIYINNAFKVIFRDLVKKEDVYVHSN